MISHTSDLESSLISAQRVDKSHGLYKDLIKYNFESADALKKFFLRFLGIILMIVSVFIFTRISFPEVSYTECIVDEVFNLTSPINSYLKDNSTIKDIFVILSSAFLDIAMIAYMIEFTLFCDSWREIITVAMFYSLRATIQSINILGLINN